MPARKCLTCKAAYPWQKGGPVECPACGEKLQYSSHATPDTDWPLEVPEVLPDLTDEERQELEADWEALKAEAQKRGPQWSIADLIGEQRPAA